MSSAGEAAGSGPRGPDAIRRRSCLLRWLAEEGRLDVVDMARRLGVAPETVRRDLRVLESRSELLRVHGGAVRLDADRLGGSPGDALVIPGPDRLAMATVHQIPSRDRELVESLWHELPRTGTLLLGTGRLTLELAQIIADPGTDTSRPSARARNRGGGLTVVTNSLDVGLVLSRASWLSVYNIGGTVSRTTRGQEGDWALAELHRLHTDVSIVCPDGVSAERGLSQATPAAAAVAQAEVAAGDRVLALVEQAALGRSSFVTFAALADVESVVVAGVPDEAAVAAIGERGVQCRYRGQDRQDVTTS